MSVVRRWVFPIIWMVVFAVIAAALTKLAFFPDTAAAPDPAVPGAEIIDPQYVVGRGTVINDVRLDGTVAADAAVPIPATLSGEVREVYVGQGAWVAAGQEILLLRGQTANPDGTVGTSWSTVTAPTAGIVSSFPTLVGQQFAVGDPVGRIAPPGFHVSGSIPPEQLYRLLQRPTEAEVTIAGGPAPFTCGNLTITTPLAGEGGTGGSGGGGGETPSGPVVTCTVPADVTVFAGLTAQLVIAGGIAEDVLVVPTTAVEGSSGTGTVYVVLADGATEPRTVTLGLTDGVLVEVVDGLEEGETILQFVPGAPAGGDPLSGLQPGQCVSTPDGGTVCT